MWIFVFVLLLKFGGVAFDESQQFGAHFQARTGASGLKGGPDAAPDSSGTFAYVQRAQQAVGSLARVVKNWVGIDEGSRP